MRQTAVVGIVAVLSITGLGAGCGSEDEEEPIQGVERTPTPTATATQASEGQSDDTITKDAFYECVAGTDLKLSKEAGPIPDTGGDIRASIELDNAQYAGFVVWPGGAIADVWIADDEDSAEKAEKEYEAFWKALGGSNGEELIQHKGNAVVGLDDDEPPTPEEAETLDACLAPILHQAADGKSRAVG